MLRTHILKRTTKTNNFLSPQISEHHKPEYMSSKMQVLDWDMLNQSTGIDRLMRSNSFIPAINWFIIHKFKHERNLSQEWSRCLDNSFLFCSIAYKSSVRHLCRMNQIHPCDKTKICCSPILPLPLCNYQKNTICEKLNSKIVFIRLWLKSLMVMLQKFVVNLRCMKVFSDTFFSSIPKFQFILV